MFALCRARQLRSRSLGLPPEALFMARTVFGWPPPDVRRTGLPSATTFLLFWRTRRNRTLFS